jgi:hypothetical protein
VLLSSVVAMKVCLVVVAVVTTLLDLQSRFPPPLTPPEVADVVCLVVVRRKGHDEEIWPNSFVALETLHTLLFVWAGFGHMLFLSSAITPHIKTAFGVNHGFIILHWLIS